MTVRIVDRRFDSKNKSSVNRSRFIQRFKGQIRKAVADAINKRGVRDLDNGEKIEKPAGISNPKDFRNEIVNFVLRARAGNAGRNPAWTSYEKLRTVIEKKMFSNTEELLPVISFNTKSSADEQKKHQDFVARMVEKGYTAKQVRLLCEWYLRVRKSS